MRSIFVENYKNASDEEIVAQICGGDYELLPVIFGRYDKRIRYYADKYCRESDREDAAQEASLALYSAVKNYDKDKSSFSSFASLCIKRSVIDCAKRAGRKKNIPEELLEPIEDVSIPDCNSPEKIFFDKEAYKALTHSIKLTSIIGYLELLSGQVVLPPDMQKKYIDIADELGVSEKSVNNALMRIRRKLKDKQGN